MITERSPRNKTATFVGHQNNEAEFRQRKERRDMQIIVTINYLTEMKKNQKN
jgi:hypothetical protein